MRKIILLLISALILFQVSSVVGCGFNGNIRSSLDSCFTDTKVVSPPEDLEVVDGGGFNTFLLLWVDALAGILAIAAVGAIAYGGLMLTLSTGEDEKITKGKDIIKWGILGFIAIIIANTLIELVINILYDI